MLRFAPVLLFACALALAGVVDAATPDPADAKALDGAAEAKQADSPDAKKADSPDAKKADSPAAKKADSPKKATKGAIPGGPNDDTALWWNDPAITKALSLKDEQREKMAAYLEEYRKAVPRDRRLDTFHETLVQGDWKGALGETEKAAKTAEASIRLRGKLKIDVLSLLTQEQLEILVGRYPRLIYKPWKRAMRGASPR